MPTFPYGKTDCETVGCDRKHYCKGFCRRCYSYHAKYNIPADVVATLKNVSCGICEKDLEAVFVDHDHSCCDTDSSCGKCVRGFLCQGCNLGLGAFRDRPELLEAAAAYLRLAILNSVG